MAKQIHVVPDKANSNWRVESANSERALRVFDTKAEAQEYARQTAINQKAELYVHNKNGQISECNSYGNDPCPPKDKR